MKRIVVKTFKYLLYAVLVSVLIFFIAVWFPFSNMGYTERNYSKLLIENVNIVDLSNDTILAHQNVLIEKNIIKEIVPRSSSPIRDDFTIIDGTDCFLIPALWDMHTHLNKQSTHSAYAEFVVNGVMHIRDMRGAVSKRDHFASTPDRINDWNQQVMTKELLGPVVHNVPSFAIEGPSKMYANSPDFFNCGNPEQARQLILHFKRQGVTMIKPYNNIPREAFFTLMSEANSAGIEVAGHKPVRVSTVEATNAGMKSIEHARFLLWDSFEGASQLRNSSNPRQLDNTMLRKEMLEKHDSLLLKTNLASLKENNTFFCPTHLTRKSDAFANDDRYRARYDDINPLFRFLSFEDLDATIQEDGAPLSQEVYYDFYKKGLEITKKANEFGIKILAGSDMPELPGTSLLEDLYELSEAGLNPYDVLKTATIYPSEYYGLDGKYGTVEIGKAADLILLSANPITNISAVEDAKGILYDGVYLNEEQIRTLKDNIKQRNNSWLMSAKIAWGMLMYMTL